MSTKHLRRQHERLAIGYVIRALQTLDSPPGDEGFWVTRSHLRDAQSELITATHPKATEIDTDAMHKVVRTFPAWWPLERAFALTLKSDFRNPRGRFAARRRQRMTRVLRAQIFVVLVALLEPARRPDTTYWPKGIGARLLALAAHLISPRAQSEFVEARMAELFDIPSRSARARYVLRHLADLPRTASLLSSSAKKPHQLAGLFLGESFYSLSLRTRPLRQVPSLSVAGVVLAITPHLIAPLMVAGFVLAAALIVRAAFRARTPMVHLEPAGESTPNAPRP